MAAPRKPNLQFRVEPEMLETIIRFCDQTNRDLPTTMRAIVEMFFAEGFDVASKRLNAGLWSERAEPVGEEEIAAEIARLLRKAEEPRAADQESARPAKAKGRRSAG